MKKDINGVTLEMIQTAIKLNQFITLIKHYRTITGADLKAAKDAIEINCLDLSRNVKPNETIRFFEKYFYTFSVSTEQLKKSLDLVLENWNLLGFKSPHQACQTVLDNFSQNNG
jgi:hypothetical protein